MTEEEEKYVYSNIQYYGPRFRRLRHRRNRANWNWVAFLVPTYWLFYRKVFPWGIALLLVTGFVCFFGGLVSLVAALIIRLFFGLYANDLYMQHVEGLVRKGHRLREQVRKRHLYFSGRPSMALGILAFVAVTVLEWFIFHTFY